MTAKGATAPPGGTKAAHAKILRVIIETPRGSRNKYAYEPSQKAFTLSKVLPAGMSFPYDFGFIPQTLAADGDPLDVLLLMDEPAFPGCTVLARVIGILEGEELTDNKRIRNDRIFAVAAASHLYADVASVDDLPLHLVKEIQDFFVNYLKLEDRTYQPLGCKGIATAEAAIAKAG